MRSEQRRRAGALLLSCLDEDRPPAASALAAVPADELVDAALWHGLGSWVAHACGRAGLGGSAVARLREASQEDAARHLRALSDLAVAAPVLDGVGAWAVVKGPVLVEHVYRTSGMRSYTDLDLLVRATDLPAVLGRLQHRGFELLDLNWELLCQQMQGEIHLRGPHRTPIDLHWSLVNDARVRAEVDVRTDDVLVRARRVPVAELTVPTLVGPDLVTYLALHAALSGADRLVWLLDIAQAARGLDETGWWDVVERAARWRAAPRVGVVLARARRTLGVPVPADVLHALLPLPWRTLASWVDLAQPVPAARGGSSLSRAVAGASVGTSRRNLVVLLRKAVQHLPELGDDRAVHERRRVEGDRSLAHSAGGEESRRRYLASAARHG